MDTASVGRGDQLAQRPQVPDRPPAPAPNRHWYGARQVLHPRVGERSCAARTLQQACQPVVCTGWGRPQEPGGLMLRQFGTGGTNLPAGP
jgi:hypothetical protein